MDVIHHVADRPAYFREAFRVLKAGGQVCTVTDSEDIIRRRRPLAEYFPETVEADLRRYPPTADLRRWTEQAGFGGLAEDAVEFAYPITDLSAYRERAYSCLHLIPVDAHRRGLERMERDLTHGPLQGNSRYLLLWATKQSQPPERAVRATANVRLAPLSRRDPMASPRKKPTASPPGTSDRSTRTALEQLPNVGPAVAGYLRRAGVHRPCDLVGRNPSATFDELCRAAGQRLDPCLLDTIIAAVRFMAGEEAKPWWAYTAQRKRELAARRREADQEGRP